jgi:hypothetical protein
MVLGALGYGLFRAVPIVSPTVREVVDNSEFVQGSILGETTDYVNDLLGNDTGNEDGSENEDEDGNNLGDVVDELASKTKDVISDKVQEDVDKIKEGAKDVANEQFCVSVLKTLEEECGKFYCSE